MRESWKQRAVTRGRPHIRSYVPPPGFEHAHHHWDSRAHAWVVQILPGEFYATGGDEVIATVLGSCVATCIRDARTGYGGMNHFLLPDDPLRDTRGTALRYGCFAVERLLNEVLKQGANRDDLEIKVFGGGRVIASLSDIGRSNVAFVHEYMHDEQLSIVAQDVGGECARRVRYHPRSGKVLVKHLPVREAAKVGAEEREFRLRLQTEAATDEVELF